MKFGGEVPKTRSLSAGIGRQVIPHSHKVKLIIRILSKLHKLSQQALKNFDCSAEPNRFETELKFFSDWFKQREESERHRYDYFYGPFQE